MAVSIQSVNGVGPAAAEALAQHGVVTPEQLAESSVEAISKVPGFSAGRAQRIITAAQALLDPPAAPTAELVADAAETTASVELDDEPVEQAPAAEAVEPGENSSGQDEDADDSGKKGKNKKDKDKKRKKKKGSKNKGKKKKNKGKKKKKK